MTRAAPRPVMVGVGGSGDGMAAIKLAATEADYRQAPLIAVMAYSRGSTRRAGAHRADAYHRFR